MSLAGRPTAANIGGRGLEPWYFVAAYLVYNGARWIFMGDLSAAQEHARWIVNLEQSAALAVEASVQAAFDLGPVRTVLANIYLAAQLLVLPGALIWLFRRSRPVYRVLRTTVITTWMLAVPIFALFPVAPPRLAGLGMADTVSEQAAFSLAGHSTIFYNPYAAVPSLHVGFAFAIGIAVAAVVTAPWAKALAWAWGPIVTLSVVATANHYVFDVAAGLVITLAGLVLGRWITERLAQHAPWLRRQAVATPRPGGAHEQRHPSPTARWGLCR